MLQRRDSQVALVARTAGEGASPEKSLAGAELYSCEHSFEVGLDPDGRLSAIDQPPHRWTGMTYVAERAIAGSHVCSAAVQAINTAARLKGSDG